MSPKTVATYMDGSGLFPISGTTVMDEYSMRNLLSSVAMLQEHEENTIQVSQTYNAIVFMHCLN